MIDPAMRGLLAGEDLAEEVDSDKPAVWLDTPMFEVADVEGSNLNGETEVAELVGTSGADAARAIVEEE